MSKGLDKLITELKGKFGSKYDIDWMQSQIKKMHEAPMPPMPEDGVAVVEVEAVPVEETTEVEATEACPECWQTPCVCEEEKPESWEAEEPKLPEESWEQAEWEQTLEDATPAEEDKMQEILKAIKTFFPNENTEDVLVRLVQKLIDR